MNMNAKISRSDLAAMIDHTLLKPEATDAQIESLCREAIEYHFGCVCVNPYWVSRCRKILVGHPVKLCTVVGFPLGCNTSRIKAIETAQALKDGANEIDVVINVGLLKSGDFKGVEEDLRLTIKEAYGAIVKVILETSLLTDSEKVIGCKIALAVGAHFVKTSTGFSQSGATSKDVALLRQTVGPTMGVKAAGGIRSLTTALEMIEAGASRLGTSSSIQIISTLENNR